MLKRWHSYVESDPLGGWVGTVAFILLFNGVLALLLPKKPNAAMSGFWILLAFITPTIHLMQRSSDERRRKSIPPRQELLIGSFALVAAIVSILSISMVLLARWGHRSIPGDSELVLIALFSFTAMFACAFGYIGRDTKPGQWGVRLALAFLCVLIVRVIFLLITLWP